MLRGSYRMPGQKVNLLVVDDDPSICKLLGAIMSRSGYTVRCASDGFTALAEIRSGIPKVIISDLNMPGMSGFEFLSVIRRRFPAIRVIAMSSAFYGNGIPLGIAADAFYAKGTDLSILLNTLVAMLAYSRPPRVARLKTGAAIWIGANGHDQNGAPYVMISCPECMRAFPQVLSSTQSGIEETSCSYCGVAIRYAIVQSAIVAAA
jgi:CheY-like chemotaxis protein